MGALDMGLTQDELEPLVTAWREANQKITQFWWDVDRAAKTAVREQIETETHGIPFTYEKSCLFITLPSGRKLAYARPRFDVSSRGTKCVVYQGMGATKKWERIESYGPKFVENIVQAVSRDILAYAMQNLRDYEIVLSVHDEIVIEADAHMSVDAICEQMVRLPGWAAGLPLRAEGFECEFYQKN
jgi:DNA polymerase